MVAAGTGRTDACSQIQKGQVLLDTSESKTDVLTISERLFHMPIVLFCQDVPVGSTVFPTRGLTCTRCILHAAHATLFYEDTAWRDLKMTIHRHFLSNMTELERIFQDERDKLTKSRCEKPVETRRTQSCNCCHRGFYSVLN